MKDRNVQYPTRFHVKPVPGTDDICEIIPAPGEVYENGTFWNKANVLKDVTAALYGLTADAVPDEVFAAIKQLIDTVESMAREGTVIADGTYTGTGNSITLNLGFRPYAGIIVRTGENGWIYANGYLNTNVNTNSYYEYSIEVGPVTDTSITIPHTRPSNTTLSPTGGGTYKYAFWGKKAE